MRCRYCKYKARKEMEGDRSLLSEMIKVLEIGMLLINLNQPLNSISDFALWVLLFFVFITSFVHHQSSFFWLNPSLWMQIKRYNQSYNNEIFHTHLPSTPSCCLIPSHVCMNYSLMLTPSSQQLTSPQCLHPSWPQLCLLYFTIKWHMLIIIIIFFGFKSYVHSFLYRNLYLSHPIIG